MAGIKTLAELEQENPDDFHNPVRTPEQEAETERLTKLKRDYEAIHTPRQTEPDEIDEDDDGGFNGEGDWGYEGED